MSDSSEQRCGFVAVAGLPNAGKSTLINALVGEKVAIVADKPQTTRTAVQGVLTLPGGQIIFVDTPGIHRSDSYFNKRMMMTVRQALDAPDVRIYVADGSRDPDEREWEGLSSLVRAHSVAPRPSILVLNKIDRVDDKRQLLPRLEAFAGHHDFTESVPVSALRGTGLDELRLLVLQHLPPGERMFPEDYLTDQPERYLAAEMIREQVLKATHDEVPHSVAVKVEEWKDEPHITRIGANIIVERPGQKGILIGSKGAMLKRIGTAARGQIENFLGRRVFLQLYVNVKPRWREIESFVNELDWRSSE
jgi:GTP-binding protein Era